MVVTNGQEISQYESAFADLFPDKPQAVSFWKGRVALSAILEALNIGPGDEVVVPAFTCVVVANAVLYRKAKPVYVDIDPDTLNLGLDHLDHCITPRTRAIIVQHSFGLPADMEGIVRATAGSNIDLIEDCAHSLGSLYRDQQVGTFGRASFFSFQWSKPYSTGLGGMALTQDQALGERLKEIQSRYIAPNPREVRVLQFQLLLYQRFYRPSLHWFARRVLNSMSRAGVFIGSSSREELWSEKPPGYEKHMSRLQAKWGISRLKELRENSDHRRELRHLYDRLLDDRGFGRLRVPKDTEPVLVRYPIMVKDKNAVLRKARHRRVEIGSWFESVLHPLGAPVTSAGYKPGLCPQGEEAARHIINFPLHPGVTEREAIRTVDFLSAMRAEGYV